MTKCAYTHSDSYNTTISVKRQKATHTQKRLTLPTHTATKLENLTGASKTNGQIRDSSQIPRHWPASAAEAASWTGTAVRSSEAELEAFAPGAPEVPEAPRAACGGVRGTWRSPDRRSSPQAPLAAAAYWWVWEAVKEEKRVQTENSAHGWMSGEILCLLAYFKLYLFILSFKKKRQFLLMKM